MKTQVRILLIYVEKDIKSLLSIFYGEKLLKPKKVVLAYSGGLDTSIILKWLHQEYNCEVVTFTADLGQGEELEPAKEKAKLLGVLEDHISWKIFKKNLFQIMSFQCLEPTLSTKVPTF